MQIKITVKQLVSCPKCNGVLKRVRRRNFTHGRKSKGYHTESAVCKKCGYNVLLEKEKKRR